MYVAHIVVFNTILLNFANGNEINQPMPPNKDQSAEALTPWDAIVINEATTQSRTMRSYKFKPSEALVRRTTTVAHVVDKTCLLKPDQGPCRAKIDMWYFNPKSMNCSTFEWGGCQGNGNRYDTESECQNTCLSQKGWKEKRPRYCSLNFDYGWCFGAVERWYYDRRWKVCKKTIYSGCGGNKNNFYNREKCDDVCRLAAFMLMPLKRQEDSIKKVLIVNPAFLTTPALKIEGPNPKTPGSSSWKSVNNIPV